MSRKPFPFRLAATVLVFGLAAALAVVSGSFAAPPAGSQGGNKGDVVREGPTPEEMQARMQQLHSWLSGETPGRATDRPIRITVSDPERAAFEGPSKGQVPLKIGMVKSVEPRVVVSHFDLAGISRAERPFAGGILQGTEDGGFIWARSVASQGAGGIRVHISDFDLPPGADLYFYSKNGEAYGPYQRNGPHRDGDFWTASVASPEGVLVLRHFGPTTANELRQITLAVTEVGHSGGKFVPPSLDAMGCGNPSCVEDAACTSNAPTDQERDAIAKMEWISGAFIYTCTAGLVADGDGNSSTNYMLTANHCLNRNREAQNVEFYWRFRKSSCNGSCPSTNGWTPKTTGSSVAATGTSGDFTLLQLSSAVPAGSFALGNDHSTNVANTNGLQLYRISNPNFGPQAYSQHNVSTTAPTCTGWPRGQRIYSRDIFG